MTGFDTRTHLRSVENFTKPMASPVWRYEVTKITHRASQGLKVAQTRSCGSKLRDQHTYLSIWRNSRSHFRGIAFEKNTRGVRASN